MVFPEFPLIRHWDARRISWFVLVELFLITEVPDFAAPTHSGESSKGR